MEAAVARQQIVRFGVLLTVSLAGACASEPVIEPVLEGKLSSLQTLVFDKSCATSSCHNATVNAGNLVLDKGASYAQLVGAFAKNAGAKKQGLKRVDPGKPDASFLVMKVQAITDDTYGQVMPTSSPTGLPAAELAAVRAWITAGAKND
jgi:hypothetical protein